MFSPRALAILFLNSRPAPPPFNSNLKSRSAPSLISEFSLGAPAILFLNFRSATTRSEILFLKSRSAPSLISEFSLGAPAILTIKSRSAPTRSEVLFLKFRLPVFSSVMRTTVVYVVAYTLFYIVGNLYVSLAL